jgi:hypothetical protein
LFVGEAIWFKGRKETFVDVKILLIQTSTKDEYINSGDLAEVKAMFPGGIVIPEVTFQETITTSQR